MCGRFSLYNILGIKALFNLYIPDWLKPRYNIAPSQEILAIINNGGYQAVQYKWGLIPFWSKDMVPGMINARAETVDIKPSFKQSLKSRRCLIPADGFYEWKKEGTRKRSYRINLKNGDVFAFAGLWDTWTSPKGAEEAWLDADTDIPTLKGILKPYRSELMESYEVSTIVNNFRNDNPEVLKPV
ncbi:MAG: SOS response-associated peptidase [Bacillota bacterium]|nr:SOS response-associated peptidase [Bacillota bacterium]